MASVALMTISIENEKHNRVFEQLTAIKCTTDLLKMKLIEYTPLIFASLTLCLLRPVPCTSHESFFVWTVCVFALKEDL